MKSAVKEAHRLVDEAAGHIANLKTILDHDTLPALPDSSDAEQQDEAPKCEYSQQDEDPKAAKKKHASAVMSTSSTTNTTNTTRGGGGGGGSPAALITALAASRSTDGAEMSAAGRVEMRRDATTSALVDRAKLRATERHDERPAAEGRQNADGLRHRAGASSPNDFHTADGLRHRAGASSPNDFQKALAEYKRQNRVTSRS